MSEPWDDPLFGEWCDVHREEMQDHDCDLRDDEAATEPEDSK